MWEEADELLKEIAAREEARNKEAREYYERQERWRIKICEDWYKEHGRYHHFDERREIERAERRKRREQREQAGGKRRRVMKPAYSDLEGDDVEMNDELLFGEGIIHSSDYSSNSESDDGNQSGFGYDNSKQNHKKRQRDGDDEGDDGDDEGDEAKENRNNGTDQVPLRKNTKTSGHVGDSSNSESDDGNQRKNTKTSGHGGDGDDEGDDGDDEGDGGDGDDDGDGGDGGYSGDGGEDEDVADVHKRQHNESGDAERDDDDDLVKENDDEHIEDFASKGSPDTPDLMTKRIEEIFSNVILRERNKVEGSLMKDIVAVLKLNNVKPAAFQENNMYYEAIRDGYTRNMPFLTSLRQKWTWFGETTYRKEMDKTIAYVEDTKAEWEELQEKSRQSNQPIDEGIQANYKLKLVARKSKTTIITRYMSAIRAVLNGDGDGGGFGLKKLQKIHLYALIFEEYIKVLVPC